MLILNLSILYTEAFLFHQIANELRPEGVEFRLFTEMSFARDELARKGADITLTRDRLMPITTPLQDELERIESHYGIANLRSMLVGDRHYAHQPEDEGLALFAQYVRLWENELTSRPVDAIFMDFGGELARRALFMVAKHRGTPVFYLNFAPFPRAIAWIDNEFNTWDDYEELPISSFSAEEVEAVDSFIDKLRNSRVNFTNVLPLKASASRFGKLLEYRRIQHKFEQGANPHFCPEKWLKNYMERRVNRFLETRFLEKIPSNEKFVLFPLHVTDDAQLTVRAPHINQEELIRQLARTLPHGYTLYVKGHPSYIGGYDWRMFKRLSKLPNIRFVDPFVHVHELLRKASALVVVNSTTGLEGLVYGLPTVVFGPTYYRGKGLTYDVNGYDQAEIVLAQALAKPSPATPERVRHFLLNLRRACYSGTAYYMYGTGSQMTPSMLEANIESFNQNAADIAASIRLKMIRIREREAQAKEATTGA